MRELAGRLFEALDELEKRLARVAIYSAAVSSKRIGASSAHFVRFDVVYHGHFKCNIRRIVDYPNLQGYLMDLFQRPGLAETVNFDHIKRHYYMTQTDINPTRIVPIGPASISAAHGREKIVCRADDWVLERQSGPALTAKRGANSARNKKLRNFVASNLRDWN